MPAAYNVVLFDRVVEFMYTGEYTPGRSLRYATDILNGFEYDDSVDFEGAKFDLHMCNLAEMLGFPTLLAHAHHRITNQLTLEFVAPTKIEEFVKLTFAMPGSEKRVCADTDGGLQKIAVTAVLVQVNQFWAKSDTDKMNMALKHDDYDAFWNLWEDLEVNCADLITTVMEMENIAGKDKRACERFSFLQRVAAKEEVVEKSAVALVKSMKRLDLNLGKETI
jgi:hypothetical protein